MIRNVELTDAKAIADIYNEYVLNGTATFEITPVSDDEMCVRIDAVSSRYPYLVYEADGVIMGYCYAHAWKERKAYQYTLETTVYIAPQYQKKGIGRLLMTELIDKCRQDGYHALIACITGGNAASVSLHLKLGFRQVSFFEKVGMKFGQSLDVADYELLLRCDGSDVGERE